MGGFIGYLNMTLDNVWIALLTAVVVFFSGLGLYALTRPRRFKPKSEQYWKEQAQRQQKRYTGQVLKGERPANPRARRYGV